MKKEIGIGFLTGLIFNAVGIAICVLVISMTKGSGFMDTLNFYIATNSAWMLISLGALPNLLAFFGFLKINREYRARGVLIATFLAAIITYLIYFGG
jgi:hypothetical protein